MMKKNIGKMDGMARFAIAAVLVALYAMGVLEGTAGIIALAAAAIMVMTSLMSFCMLYTLLGMNTCGKDESCGTTNNSQEPAQGRGKGEGFRNGGQGKGHGNGGCCGHCGSDDDTEEKK